MYGAVAVNEGVVYDAEVHDYKITGSKNKHLGTPLDVEVDD